MLRHLLTLNDLSKDEAQYLIARATKLKKMWYSSSEAPQIMNNRTLALVFDKSSTRTRVSFEVATHHFGGSTIFLASGDSQLKRGESLSDTARVLSSMVDLIVVRTGAHSNLECYAENSIVPVVNGLSDSFHPCQLLADIQTYCEIRGKVQGAKVAWIGDGNNVCNSWAIASQKFDFDLRISTPADYAPNLDFLPEQSANIQLISDPMEAAKGVDIVVTDTWASMGQEYEKEHRQKQFEAYRVTQKVMDQANPNAVFMHCLPAYRGMEVDAEVIDGPQSVVWEEAENRLHAQKALIELLLQWHLGDELL